LTPGVHIVTREDTTMAKAKTNGSYELNGHYYKVRKGDVLPDGAVMAGDEPEPEAEPVEESTEQRAQKSAPENKAKQSAPEQK
jgi:hypothetical protein